MDILNRQFGLVIAYLLPGFVALGGVAPFVPIVSKWLSGDQTATFGAPLYALLAATAAGMVVSCFRWLVVDHLHGFTGLGTPAFNAKALEERPTAFQLLVESHYRYYQFYANTLVALAFTYLILRSRTSVLGLGTDLAVAVIAIALFAGSRDALMKYRTRSWQLIEFNTHSRTFGGNMTNGIDHNQGSSSKPAAPKAPAKPEVPAKPTPKQTPKES